jgi:hypothetical protein
LHTMEQWGITRVISETNSKSVVDAICHLRGGSSEFSFLQKHKICPHGY